MSELKAMSLEAIHVEERRFLQTELPFDLSLRAGCEGYESIRVQLLYPPKSIERLCYVEWVWAAFHMAVCTWLSRPFGDQWSWGLSWSDQERILYGILAERKISAILESQTFVFSMDGISRSMTHQIVRHRQMAFSQQSFRVSNALGSPCRIPASLEHRIEKLVSSGDGGYSGEEARVMLGFRSNWKAAVQIAQEVYAKGIALGLPVEQVRDILPHGTTTKIDVVMRLREVLQYVNDRTQEISQGEHEFIVIQLIRALAREAPHWFMLVCHLAPRAKEIAVREGIKCELPLL